MDFKQIDAELPSLSRWIRLNRKYPKHSTLRMLEYEALEKIDFSGRMLDIGGGGKSKYRDFFPESVDYCSVNIDKSIEPTWIVEPGEPLPLDDDSFDCCISLNTFEHVYDTKSLLEDAYRVLKPGGTMYISVPWIFRIHGHPDDFSRVTPSWWRAVTEEVGFRSCSVLPLVWGRYSTSGSIAGYRFLRKLWGRHLDHINDIIYVNIAARGKNNCFHSVKGQRFYNVALGHFVYATK